MSSYAAEMPLLNLDAIPFIVRGFDDARLLWKVSRTAVEEALAQRGVRLLYAAPWPPQALLSRVPVQQLSDLKGQQFRVYNEATRRIDPSRQAHAHAFAHDARMRALHGRHRARQLPDEGLR